MSKGITKPQIVTLWASGARGTTTSRAESTEDNNAVVLQLDVTAKSGTNPTLDVVVYDGPTENGPWSVLYTFSQLTDAGNVAAAPTRSPMGYIRAIATVGGTATPLFTFSLVYAAFKGVGNLIINTGSQGGAGAFTGLTVTSADASAFTVGRLGATTPALKVDASTGSSVTGLQIKSAAAASGVALLVISSGTNENLTLDAKGSGTISLNVTGTGNIVLGRAATGVSLVVTGALTSSGTAGVGYSTGAGGSVTQATDKSTGVTLSKTTGQITLNNAALAAGAEAIFTVTNTLIGTNDVVIVNHISAGTPGAYLAQACHVQNGASFDIVVSNVSAGSLSEAIVLQFVIIKGVAA